MADTKSAVVPVEVEQPGAIYGTFADGEQAERAYQYLIDKGYDRHSVGVVMTQESRERYFPNEPERDAASETGGENRMLEGAGITSAAGALVGALAAIGVAVTGPASLPLIAAGLAGAGYGGLIGGIFGGLLGSTIPKDEAEHFERGLREGKILIRVIPQSLEEMHEIRDEWTRLGGEVKEGDVSLEDVQTS